MFKLVVLSALVAVAIAKPSGLIAPVVTNTYVAPAAVSSTYREDVIHKPAAVAYAAPAPVVYSAPVVAPAPVVAAAPVVAKTVVAPAAVSHTYREDVVSKPAAVAYAAPAVSYAAPAVSYAAPAVSYAAPAVSYAAPVAYAAPAAVSSSYRSDIISSPVVSAHAVYAAAAPAVHAW
ncbi:hypothetical protein ABEB36_009097 [Hypothenemus hampei]|uniref:Cuticle protein 16.5-like n=1 Tax=Hypothenemus hampei TaxID=57062 RepID=A0ABD1EP56_HYPHA